MTANRSGGNVPSATRKKQAQRKKVNLKPTETYVGRIIEPVNPRERERRPVVGFESHYEITRTGLFWAVAEQMWVAPAPKWPYIKALQWDASQRDYNQLNFNVVTLLATTWLTAQQRAQLRAMGPQEKPWAARLLALERKWRVPVYALACAANSTSDEELMRPRPAVRGTLNNEKLTEYKIYLLEEPCQTLGKLDGSRALHAHALRIGGRQYSFLAMGARKFVFASDTVSFDYVVTSEGYRNIVPQSLVVLDKNGNPIKRGIRCSEKWPAPLAERARGRPQREVM